jgi:hypothetical protein
VRCFSPNPTGLKGHTQRTSIAPPAVSGWPNEFRSPNPFSDTVLILRWCRGSTNPHARGRIFELSSGQTSGQVCGCSTVDTFLAVHVQSPPCPISPINGRGIYMITISGGDQQSAGGLSDSHRPEAFRGFQTPIVPRLSEIFRFSDIHLTGIFRHPSYRDFQTSIIPGFQGFPGLPGFATRSWVSGFRDEFVGVWIPVTKTCG